MAVTADYSGYMLFFFENGKAAKVEMASYATKTNRRKLVGAYSDKSPAVAIAQIAEDAEFMLTATSGRMLLVHTGAISAKSTRNTIGVQVMTLKGRHRLQKAEPFAEGMVTKPNGTAPNPCRRRGSPSRGRRWRTAHAGVNKGAPAGSPLLLTGKKTAAGRSGPNGSGFFRQRFTANARWL